MRDATRSYLKRMVRMIPDVGLLEGLIEMADRDYDREWENGRRAWIDAYADCRRGRTSVDPAEAQAHFHEEASEYLEIKCIVSDELMRRRRKMAERSGEGE